MCYNTVILNTDKSKTQNIGELLTYIFESYRYNHDGAFIYNSFTGQYVRTLNYEEFKQILRNQVLGYGYVHMHLRLASHGSINESNIHGWEIGGYLCSHNGSYFNGSMSYLPSQLPSRQLVSNDNTDSYQFFMTNKSEINQGKISKINVNGFFGVAFCTPKNNDSKMILISKNKSIKVYKYGSLLMFSNEPLDFVYRPIEFGGFKFDNVVKSEVENEILLYDFKKLKVVKRRKVHEIKYNYYYPFYGDNIYYKSTSDKDKDIDTNDLENFHYRCKEINGELECRWEFDSGD